MAALLSLQGVTTGYGAIRVVRDLDLHVDAGEVVALVGPNGAGKTTTLLTVAGLLRPSRGEIEFDGESIAGIEPHVAVRRGLSFVPDDRALLPSLTVAENLRLPRNQKRGAYELFPELAPLEDRRAGLLSGGEQQMLALARVLVTEPKLLMVDEPSLGLAPLVVRRLLDMLHAAAKERGIGVLLVEQHVQQALAMADRAYVMVHGSVVLSGEAADLLSRRDLLESTYLAARLDDVEARG